MHGIIRLLACNCLLDCFVWRSLHCLPVSFCDCVFLFGLQACMWGRVHSAWEPFLFYSSCCKQLDYSSHFHIALQQQQLHMHGSEVVYVTSPPPPPPPLTTLCKWWMRASLGECHNTRQTTRHPKQQPTSKRSPKATRHAKQAQSQEEEKKTGKR